MRHLALQTLGPFQASLNGAPLEHLRTDKVRALLVYLALESDRPHRRETLAALLWPDSTEEAAHRSLRQALSTLRAALQEDSGQGPPFLLVTRQQVQWNPAAPPDLDASVFSGLLMAARRHPHPELTTCEACIAHLAQAAGMYHGELLAGFSLPVSLAFEDWLLLARERFRLDVIDILGFLARAYVHKGDERAAMLTARRQLALDPWNEQATRLLMEVLDGRGHRAAALAEYERCRRLMADELATVPSPETQSLAERIRQQAEPALPTSPAVLARLPDGESGSLPKLPRPLMPLVGRQDELGQLLDLLGCPEVRLITLLGPPGVGKTRLALALAEQWEAQSSAQRAAYLDLAAVSKPENLLDWLSQTLGVGEIAATPILDRLPRLLEEQPTMLVLDHFEHLLPAVSQIAVLLAACPGLRLVVISRAPLQLAGERRFPLSPLALPDLDELPPLQDLAANPAVAFFINCAQAVDPSFSLTAANAAAVAGICVRMDGLPLAIELAAAGVRLLRPVRLLERLSRPPQAGASAGIPAMRLLQGRGGRSSLHTLRQAIQWSWNQLEPDQQTLFARLAVFSGSFDLEAVEAVCQLGDLTNDLLDDLSILLDNSLLQRLEYSPEDYRFSMLEMLREFALERLDDRAETAQLRQRHADYYLSFAVMAEPGLSGHEQVYWLERVAAEQRNLRQVLEWCREHAPGQFLAFALALFPFWHTRAFLSEGRGWLEGALAASPDPSPARARALAAAGLLAQRQGDYRKAHELAQAGVDLARQINHPQGLAYALNNLGIVHLSTSDNRGAQVLAEESLAICQQQGFPLGVARAQMILGQAALNEGRLDDACQALEASLGFWRSNGDQKNAALCLINLGRVHLAQGGYPAARSLFEQAMTTAVGIKDRQFEAIALWNLGDIALRLGQPDAARASFNNSLQLARRLGDFYFEALSLNRLGAVAVQQADFTAARNLLEEGLALSRRLEDTWAEADALYHLGSAALAQNDLRLARAYLIESARLFQQQGELSLLAQVQDALVQVEQRQGGA